MKTEFQYNPTLTAQQNEILRKAFNQPEITKTVTTVPTTDTLQEGEQALYSDGTYQWLYINLSGSILRTQLSDSTASSDVAWTDYSGTSTIVGWISISTKFIYYTKVGKLVFVNYYIYGTSNATGVSFTLPYVSVNAPLNFPSGQNYDNGVTLTTPGEIYIAANSSTVACYKDMAGAAWTNTGGKTVWGNFCYPIP
jgi:hypothetical protein